MNLFCKYCGNELQDGAFCQNCGNKVDDIIAPQNNSCITVYRKSSFAGMATDFEIFVDNMKLGNIKNGQSVIYEMSAGVHSIFVKQFANRSNTINFECCGKVDFEVGYSGFKMILTQLNTCINKHMPNQTIQNEELYTDYNNNGILLYIKGASTGNFNVYSDDGTQVAQVRHIPLNLSYSVNMDGLVYEFSENVKGTYTVTCNGNVVMEVSQRTNLTMGLGLRTFVAIPLANIPMGMFLASTRYGDMYIKKEGKLHNMYLNSTLIASIDDKPTSFLKNLYSIGNRRNLTIFDERVAEEATLFFIIRAIRLMQ